MTSTLLSPSDATTRRTGAAGLAAALAAAAPHWLDLVEYRARSRWTHLLPTDEAAAVLDPDLHADLADAQVWLLSWLPEQGTPLHDHGTSAGAFSVVRGILTERVVAAGRTGVHERTDELTAGRVRHFGPHYVHQVTNTGARAGGQRARLHPGPGLDEHLPGRRPGPRPHRHRARGGGLVSAPALPRPRTIDELLAEARSRIERVTPREAAARIADGALLVDIRPAAQRAREGEVPGSLIVERNVLEWRFDPASDARLPQATGYDVDVIVLCSEGYTSSLAADALRSLGLHRATDVIGGFLAWAAAGLPTT